MRKSSEERLCAHVRYSSDVVTIEGAAKALGLTVRTVRNLAESSERIIVNVAIGSCGGYSSLRVKDYILQWSPPDPSGTERGYSIWNPDSGIYYNSFMDNAEDAVVCHLCSLGTTWEEQYAKGDRVVHTELRIIGEYHGR